ncbi:MAG: serine hydrolase domain-containing protein [Wenzhouxiangellaceae bacterium]
MLAFALSASGAASANELARQVAQLREATGVPGIGAVRVSANGIEDSAVDGVRAQGRETPIESDDPWHLGSNAKAMTAMLAAILVGKGIVDWDDAVTDHLSDLNVEIHSDWRFATLTQLLTHCSGLPPNVSRLKMISLAGGDGNRDATADRRDYAETLLDDPPLHQPGTRFLYSNAGYVVAGAMLEAATRQPFAELMRKHIFEPLEMSSAEIGPPGSPDKLDAPRGHRPGILGFGPVKPGAMADNPPALTPAGRFHMTLADYSRFLTEVLRGNDGNGRLLDRAAHRFLVEPGCSKDYAKGWGLADGWLTHAGSNTMWFVLAGVDLQHGRAAAIASNDGRIDRQHTAFKEALDKLLAQDFDLDKPETDKK